MIEGFDKEIDALLRRSGQRRTAPAEIDLKSETRNPKLEFHLDADEISAFAENALPERLKPKYTAHFAGCDRCRTILANTIALDAEAEAKTEIVSVAAPKIAAASIPWHRRFFAFPRLAYALGALVVLFGGFFAFLVVRNANEATGSADVSQSYDTPPRASGPSFETEAELPVPNAMSNTATAGNMASNAMMSNVASTATSNSTRSASADSAARTSSANTAFVKSNSSLKDEEPAAVKSEDDRNAAQNQAGAPMTETADSSASRLRENEKTNAATPPPDKKTTVSQDASNAQELPMSARSTSATVRADTDAPKARLQKSKPAGAENRHIGGKNFTRKEGVWYDASYNGQAMTNVSRGSGDYQKLDAGLRSIAGSLSGTIVIVWKNKAYRIQ